MAQQPSNFDPLTGLYHADPLWRRYQPQAPRPAPAGTPEPSWWERLKGVDVGPLPPLPASPKLSQAAALKVPGMPPADVPQGGGMEGVTNATAHWTTPEERSALGATRQTSNYRPAFAGLRAAVGDQPGVMSTGPIEAPRRNQAAAEFYAKGLGLGPEAAEGSISERDLRDVYEREQARRDAMEMAKLQSPERVARITAAGDVAREQEVARGKQQLQATDPQGEYYRELGGFLKRPPQSGDTRKISHAGPGGLSFTYDKPTSAAYFAPLRKARADLKTATGTWYNSPDYDKLKADVARLEQLAGIPSGAPLPDEGGGNTQEMEAFAQEIMSHPEAKDLPWEQLQAWFPHGQDEREALTPAQVEQLQAILARQRGF